MWLAFCFCMRWPLTKVVTAELHIYALAELSKKGADGVEEAAACAVVLYSFALYGGCNNNAKYNLPVLLETER